MIFGILMSCAKLAVLAPRASAKAAINLIFCIVISSKKMRYGDLINFLVQYCQA
jgi:hypothetical protein